MSVVGDNNVAKISDVACTSFIRFKSQPQTLLYRVTCASTYLVTPSLFSLLVVVSLTATFLPLPLFYEKVKLTAKNAGDRGPRG